VRSMNKAGLMVVLAALGAQLPIGAGSAQSIDPRVLESLQSQLGSGNTAGQQQAPAPRTTAPVQPQVGRVDTPEEQELRRQEARRQLQRLYQPSRIEQDYRRRLDDSQIRQFGYDFFQSAPPPTGVRTGAIGNDYVLGIGDQVQVSFRGATNRNLSTAVDRDGRLIVGDLRPIPAAGRTLGSIQADVAAETRRTLLATDVFVSVGEVRSVSVFVGGEVERPGQFSLTSASDIGTALAQAGGVRRSGSLRQVRIVRAGGETVSVDLYGLLGIGAPSSIRLRDGDRVIVPVIGPTVAVTGAVARPGIYELRGTASVGAVVAFAGGAIRQRGGQVVISRIAADGTESFVRTPSQSASVVGGDVVQLLGGSAGGTSGRVELSGNVDNPGPRPIVAAGTVAELVGSADDLRDDTYQLATILRRRDPSTGARMYEVLNLARELRERPSTVLQGEDRLFVFSRSDVEFMNSASVRQIVLGRPNDIVRCRSLKRLEQLVKDTEASRFSAVTRGSFVIVSEQGARLGGVGASVGQNSRRTTDLAITGRAGAREQEATVLDTERRPGELLRDDEDEIPEEERSPCPKVFESDPELLAVLLEHSISVGGAVRRPGAYPVGGSASARDLSLIADGLIAGSRDLTLDINRATADPAERIQADRDGSMLALTRVGPGDDIRFNAQQAAFEGSGVLLSGEVGRPGLYAIRRGETLAQLIERAGGLTTYAYPFGTVFTRRSVREAQEEGFRRTARELNNSLLAIAARSNQTGGGNLEGAAALIKVLSTAEAPGRLVVEADPRVLELRPDLDTTLEAGDAIFVPKRPNYVLALGDVNNPGALQFVPGKAAGLYLREAGGTLSTADNKRAFLVLPNGTAQPISTSGRGGGTPPPGTTIIVPKNIDPLYRLSVFRDVTAIIAQLASSVATVAVLANN
jgi:polysaccharide biosynthesis/export protein